MLDLIIERQALTADEKTAAAAMPHHFIVRTFRRKTAPRDRVEYRLFVRFDPARGPILEGYTEAWTGYGKRVVFAYVDWSCWWDRPGDDGKTQVLATEEVRARIPPALIALIIALYEQEHAHGNTTG